MFSQLWGKAGGGGGAIQQMRQFIPIRFHTLGLRAVSQTPIGRERSLLLAVVYCCLAFGPACLTPRFSHCPVTLQQNPGTLIHQDIASLCFGGFGVWGAGMALSCWQSAADVPGTGMGPILHQPRPRGRGVIVGALGQPTRLGAIAPRVHR